MRVEALGMEDRPLETPAMVGRGGEAVRFNWSHSIPVAAGNRAWGALALIWVFATALGLCGRQARLSFMWATLGHVSNTHLNKQKKDKL